MSIRVALFAMPDRWMQAVKVPEMEDPFWGRDLTPEESLLIAIFRRALIDCYSSRDNLKTEDAREARRYFKNFDEEEYGSFGHFCLWFDIYPKELIKKLEEDGWLQAQRKEP